MAAKKGGKRKPKFRVGQRVMIVHLPVTVTEVGKRCIAVEICGHRLNLYPDELRPLTARERGD